MSGEDTGAPEDTKNKFREALERKKGKQHPHEEASQADSKVQAHEAAGGKRVHRRKSG